MLNCFEILAGHVYNHIVAFYDQLVYTAWPKNIFIFENRKL